MGREAVRSQRLAASGTDRGGRSAARLAWLVLAAVTVGSGCLGGAALRRSIDQFYVQHPDEAADAIERYGRQVGPNDRLLYFLNAGIVQHVLGGYDKSNELLEAADARVEELVTRSVTREAASFVLNDRTTPYAGAPFEQALINYYKALNYALLGRIDEALVECRRLDIRLSDLHARRSGKDGYDEDAFLRYVVGMLYEAGREINDAFISYRKALELYETRPMYDTLATPPDLPSSVLRTARRLGFRQEAREILEQYPRLDASASTASSQVIVLLHAGRVPRRINGSIVVPSKRGGALVLAFPHLVGVDRKQRSVEVRAGKLRRRAHLANDLGRLAEQNLEDQRLRQMAKMVARAAIKETLARQAGKAGGGWAELGVRLAGAVTEAADTRAWETLPAQVYVARLSVTAGVVPLQVAVDGRAVVDEMVEVIRGQTIFRKYRVF